MRRVRAIVALASVSGALLVGALGIGAPAQAAVGNSSQAALSYGAPSPYPFGAYYTLEACRYFGDSLVAGGTWRYYSCTYEWRSGEPQGYYYLVMYN